MMKRRNIIWMSLMCLVPTLIGAFYWNKLPDQLATHWDFQGEVNGYSTKAFVVFALPCFMAILNVVIDILRKSDPSKAAQNKSLLRLIHLSFPCLSMFCCMISYMSALGVEVAVSQFTLTFLGLMIAGIGVYLPKCPQNYMIGIKLPWTLNSASNWEVTHRVAGPIWMIGGIIIFISGLFSWFILFYFALALIIIVPCIVSYRFYKQHEEQ